VGSDRGKVMARRHPRSGAGGAGSGGTVETRPGLAGAVEKTKPTSGAHVSAGGWREVAENRRRESKKKTYFCKYVNGARGPSGVGWQSWLRPVGGEGPAGPAGPKAEWAGKGSRAESEEERFLN
jgi:hypothetical protein